MLTQQSQQTPTPTRDPVLGTAPKAYPRTGETQPPPENQDPALPCLNTASRTSSIHPKLNKN